MVVPMMWCVVCLQTSQFYKDGLIFCASPGLLTSSRQKKIFLVHFQADYHNILKNPVARRGPYMFPLPWDVNRQISVPPVPSVTQNVESTSGNLSSSSEGPLKRLLPSDTTLHNKSKKAVNYDLLLSQKNDEISDLTNKIKSLKIEISELSKEVAKKQDLDETISKILDGSCLGEHTKSMIMLLLSQKNKHVYNKKEKSLCQSLNYKNPGAYKHLRGLLDNKLPSARTLTR